MATTKFRKRGNRVRMSQHFDREKITMKRAIGEINNYDFIQEGRADTEVYPTLEKYGTLKPIILERENVEQMFQDLTDIQNLGGMRGVLDHKKKTEEMFYSLPHDVRKEFNNNINTFSKNGLDYINKKINEFKQKEEIKIETPTTGEVA